jgi:hypothetical protein
MRVEYDQADHVSVGGDDVADKLLRALEATSPAECRMAADGASQPFEWPMVAENASLA